MHAHDGDDDVCDAGHGDDISLGDEASWRVYDEISLLLASSSLPVLQCKGF